jgi:hypothetical protein
MIILIGSLIENVVPSSTTEVNLICPPSRSNRRFTIVNPEPNPAKLLFFELLLFLKS